MDPIQINNINYGGIADSEFSGLPNSVSELVGIDVHSEPGLIKVHQKLTKITAENSPSELCKEFVVCSNGSEYWFSSTTGKVWQNTSDVWTLKYTTVPLNGEAKCLGAYEYDGFIYWATQNFVHRIKVSDALSTWNTTTVELNWGDLTLDQEPSRKASIALNFDGVDDYIAIASDTLNHTDVTFSCWFWAAKDTSDVIKMKILGTNDTADSMQVELGGDNTEAPNRNRVAIYSGSTLIAQTDNNAFEAESWNHLVYTRSSNTHKIYVNGVEKGLLTSGTTAFASTTIARYLGTKNTSLADIFKGQLADLRVQTTVLTETEVLETYENIAHIETGSQAYYPLNNTLEDFGSEAAVATSSGSPEYRYVDDKELPFRANISNSLVETDRNKKHFKANSETLDYIKIWIVEPGASNLTLTIHDDSDTLVGSAVTVLNANLVAGYNYVNMNISGLTYGANYHIHVHSSGTDMYALANNYNDLSDAYYMLLSDGDIEFHPMLIQNLVLFIGDRNYIHQVDKNRADGSHVFTTRALDFVAPLRAKCLGIFNTDLLIGTKVDNRIAKSLIVRWNTWSVSYDVSDPIPEPGINAFIDADNHILVSCGTNGNIYFYNGSTLEIMRTMKGNFDAGGKVTVHTRATANFKGLPLFGISNVSGNPMSQGIYSYGNRNAEYPRIVSLDYPISERLEGEFVMEGIEIGAIMVAGNDMYVSWKNGSTIGMDKLDYSNKLDGAYITTLYMDISKIYADNYKIFTAKYATAPEDTSITAEYSKNYGGFIDLGLRQVDDDLHFQNEETVPASVLQVKIKFNTDDNNAPTMTDFIIQVE